MNRWIYFLLPLALSSCSVMLASRKGGVSAEDLQHLCTREDVLKISEKPLKSEKNAEGHLVEVYAIPAQKGSIFRAAVHAVLDVPTFFLWELIGTPIEAALSEQKYVEIQATFDPQERLLSLDLP